MTSDDIFIDNRRRFEALKAEWEGKAKAAVELVRTSGSRKATKEECAAVAERLRKLLGVTPDNPILKTPPPPPFSEPSEN